MRFIETNNIKITYENSNVINLDELKLVSQTIIPDGQSVVNKTADEQWAENIYLKKTSERNNKNFYILHEENDEILLNIIPQKKFIDSTNIKYLINTDFEYYEPPNVANELRDPVVFDDGTIFRVIGEGVKSKEQYTYYIISNGKVQKISNYKTVEVLLAERGRIFEDIQVIELIVFEDLLRTTYVNMYIEQGLSPEDAEQSAAEKMVMLASQSNSR